MLIDWLACTLDPAEREAVLGDLAEDNESARVVLRDLLGLVARRQAQLWKHPGPWLALLALIPVSALVKQAARYTADGIAIDLWMFANNWDPAFPKDPAYRDALFHSSIAAAFDLVILASWTWSAGLVLRLLAKRAAPVIGTLLCLALLAPAKDRVLPEHAVVFDTFFYRVIFPVLIQACLVIPAAIAGLRRQTRAIIPHAAAGFTIATLILQFFLTPYLRPSTWLLILSCWPVAFWLTTPFRKGTT